MRTAPRRKKFFRTGLTSKILFRYFLLASFLVLLVGALIRFAGIYSSRLWRGDERFTVLLVGQQPEIVSYQEGVGLATIPLETGVEVEGAFGVGKWRIGSLYELGKIQGMGTKLLVLTLQNTFGLPIDGWISQSPQLDHEGLNLPKTLFLAAFDKDSNLTLFDRVRIAIVLVTVPDQLRHKISLSASLPRRLVDGKVAQEGVGVGIVNRSNKSGLGKRAVKVIEGLGAPVLWVRTEEEMSKRCLVRGSQKTLDSLTAKKINRLFSCRVEEDTSLTSSIELILGKEIAPEFP